MKQSNSNRFHMEYVNCFLNSHWSQTDDILSILWKKKKLRIEAQVSVSRLNCFHAYDYCFASEFAQFKGINWINSNIPEWSSHVKIQSVSQVARDEYASGKAQNLPYKWVAPSSRIHRRVQLPRACRRLYTNTHVCQPGPLWCAFPTQNEPAS